MKSNRRGIRNNNPFNIRISTHPWIGKVKKGTDPDFEQFENMYFGIRAGLKLLINYVARGFDTPQKIIARFAPCSENNVDNYVSFICGDSRGCFFIAPDERVSSLRKFCMLASRMAKYECKLGYAEMVNFKLLPEDLREFISVYGLNKNNVLSD